MPAPHALLSLPDPARPVLPGLLRKVRLLAARRLLGFAAAALPAAQRPGLRALQALLPGLLRSAPERTLAALGAPDVLPSLLAFDVGVVPAGACIAAAVPHLLAALGTAPEDLFWPGPVVHLQAPEGVGRAFDPPARALVLGPRGLRVETEAGQFDWPEGDATSLPLRAGRLSLWDSNPLAMLEEHPDKEGNALDLAGRSPSEWTGALDAALEVIQSAVPAWAAELPLILRRAVPVGWFPELHLSASYREAPGIVYLSLHPSTLTLAEALVHECQHGKLNLLSWLDPILHNGRTTWTPSPVRPDLRPLMGVLLAAHAFVPDAPLHHALAELGHALADAPGLARRRAQVLASNARGLAILDELAEPSPAGQRLLAGLKAVQEACAQDAPEVPGVDPERLPDG